jgi:hypothetical protein
MTQDNLFREIDEDIERQKIEAFWKRYGNVVLVIAAITVLAASVFSYKNKEKVAKTQQLTGELAAIMDETEKNETKEITDLQLFAQDNPGRTQTTYAELQAAALLAKNGDTDKAVALYDLVAQDEKADHAYRQLGDLFSVELQLDKGEPAPLQRRLEPLMSDNEPWHFSAMELSGYLSLRAGDKASATRIFTSLAQDARVPQTISLRAGDMVRLLSE